MSEAKCGAIMQVSSCFGAIFGWRMKIVPKHYGKNEKLKFY